LAFGFAFKPQSISQKTTIFSPKLNWDRSRRRLRLEKLGRIVDTLKNLPLYVFAACNITAQEPTMKSEPARVREFVRQILLSCRRLLGIRWHGLHSPLSEAAVLEFEHRHSIVLPADYRHFITHIGNGGYGGLFRLGDLRGKPWQEGDGFVGVLSRAFPHREAWNDRSGAPSEELSRTDPDAGERQRVAFEKMYFDSSWVNGALPVCDEGSGALVWLVVTGEEAGHLWQDDRYADGGIYPLKLTSGEPATFSAWYGSQVDWKP